MLSDFRTPPRTMPLALSFDLDQPRDSTYSILCFACVKSASSFRSFHLQLVRETSDTDGRRSLVINLVSLVSHVSLASHVSLVSKSLGFR